MIKLLRVDDRLIHGQVAVSWTSYLGADTIVVANDKAITDKLMQMAFNMALWLSSIIRSMRPGPFSW